MRDRAILRAVILLGLLISTVSSPAHAQDTNLSIYQRLALECLGELPSDIDTLALEASTQMPYLRTALVDQWKSNGHEIYSHGEASPSPSPLPRLAFSIENADVAYARAGRSRLDRTIRLGLQVALTDRDGRIILDERCVKSAADTIDRSDVRQFEDEAFAETQGDLPRAGWVRRFVEPAVITAATAIGVYLFFTLRSQSADDE